MKKFVFLLPLLLLFSCNKTTLFTKTIDDFDNNRWQKSEVKTFEFDIKKDVENADIKLIFSHTFDPQYERVPLELTIQSPDGVKDNMFLNLQLKDGSGNSISDCAGDICDLEMNLKEEMKMLAGKYIITVENKFEGEYIPNVLALGIMVENED
ncbi:gliding motility lipoprotein GldH [Flavobacterium salilacus subsp. salilacus]|uniref:hypothetical protein n=1 Tax=Flavobacterium TaxID=237 RepID=UPI001074DED0|nr:MULTISPECIES: hypothetical protein [Flavobacterium]KAF2519789.1 gliding motility lipoprotein GldH [Flavobacterium salilacus subsp. salilacus]MBE1614312.1 hypothetical protein [Flavobacterium sp. SaA2.13]NDI97605.1 gliding motility lipoprotein GldH [Flavobacterium salilacus subsp. altitudinum]